MLDIQKKLSKPFLALLALPATAVGFALSTQIAALSWILSKKYGLDIHDVAFVWLAGPIAGIFKTFGDAPGGSSEELKEIMWSVGAEYAYNNQFFVRGGYFNENAMKGNRKYFTAGVGFKLNMFQLDAAYLISAAQSNPLDLTLRFTLGFDLNGLQNLMR